MVGRIKIKNQLAELKVIIKISLTEFKKIKISLAELKIIKISLAELKVIIIKIISLAELSQQEQAEDLN